MENTDLCPSCFRAGFSGICGWCGYSPDKETTVYTGLPAYELVGGRYLIGRILGKGGFGITYAALDTKTGKKLCIKEFFPDKIAYRINSTCEVGVADENRQKYENWLKNFWEEAKALQAMLNKPGIVNIISYIKQNNTAYIVMEFVGGVTLRKFLKNSGGRLSPAQAQAILKNVGEALRYVHDKGLLHGDVAPDNIMITNATTLSTVLIDFGSTKTAVHDPGLMMIKPHYAAPEQYNANGNHGPWSDVYSLGGVIYRCLSGNVPPTVQDRTSEKEPLIPLSSINPEVPPRLSSAVQRAMEMDVSKRFHSVSEFLYAAYQQPDIHPPQPDKPVEQNWWKLRKRPYIYILSGEEKGSKFPFAPDKSYFVGRRVQGRNYDNVLEITNNKTVGKLHFAIRYSSITKTFYIRDNHSVNGIYTLNGVRVKDDTEITMYPGDRFWVGSSQCPVEVNVE